MLTTRADLQALQETFSDFHKDVHGYRPRWMTETQWNDVAWLEQAILDLRLYCETLAYRMQVADEFVDQDVIAYSQLF